jgi:hypothetical protein
VLRQRGFECSCLKPYDACFAAQRLIQSVEALNWLPACLHSILACPRGVPGLLCCPAPCSHTDSMLLLRPIRVPAADMSFSAAAWPGC